MLSQKIYYLQEDVIGDIKIPEMEVPNLTSRDYESLHTSFQAMAPRTIRNDNITL